MGRRASPRMRVRVRRTSLFLPDDDWRTTLHFFQDLGRSWHRTSAFVLHALVAQFDAPEIVLRLKGDQQRVVHPQRKFASIVRSVPRDTTSTSCVG